MGMGGKSSSEKEQKGRSPDFTYSDDKSDPSRLGPGFTVLAPRPSDYPAAGNQSGAATENLGGGTEGADGAPPHENTVLRYLVDQIEILKKQVQEKGPAGGLVPSGAVASNGPPSSWVGGISSKIEQTQAILTSPAFGILVKLATNDHFSKGLVGLARFGDWHQFFLVQLIVLLMSLLFKNWFLSRIDPEAWGIQFVTGFLVTICSWALIFYFVPAYIIGPAFTSMMYGLYQVMFG